MAYEYKWLRYTQCLKKINCAIAIWWVRQYATLLSYLHYCRGMVNRDLPLSVMRALLVEGRDGEEDTEIEKVSTSNLSSAQPTIELRLVLVWHGGQRIQERWEDGSGVTWDKGCTKWEDLQRTDLKGVGRIWRDWRSCCHQVLIFAILVGTCENAAGQRFGRSCTRELFNPQTWCNGSCGSGNAFPALWEKVI